MLRNLAKRLNQQGCREQVLSAPDSPPLFKTSKNYRKVRWIHTAMHDFKFIWNSKMLRVAKRILKNKVRKTISTMYHNYLFTFRERGREKERVRNTDVRENHQLAAPWHAPQSGSRPATQACALTGNRTGNLLLCGMMPNQLCHTSQNITSYS